MHISFKKILSKNKKKLLFRFIRGYFWFMCGALLGSFFFISFSYIIYKNRYAHVVIPGVYVDRKDFSGKSRQDVFNYFQTKNEKIQKSTFVFTSQDKIATISAKELDFGYDADLLADQAYSIGRTSNFFSDFTLMMQSYLFGIYLSPSYHYDEAVLQRQLDPIQKELFIAPIDARFTFIDGKVKEFHTSSEGQILDVVTLKQLIASKTLAVITSTHPQVFNIQIPIKILKPKIATEEVNNMGIKELLATGNSLFIGSIPNRIYNITLAASKLDGVLIKPGEIFSFSKEIGDISTLTGYKQAYVIQNGRTVLGDGGGVCQVSTTLFRAVLHAGLPVVERNPHAYRVGYYEQDEGPGLDAAVFIPTVDFKFKNDTANYILIQTYVDPNEGRLTFELYGTKDNRVSTISKPVVTNITSSPEPLYIDDPTLPKGQMKQIDYAVPGASVYFTRTVIKDRKEIINEKFKSYYRAWQAVYMRGTKEG